MKKLAITAALCGAIGSAGTALAADPVPSNPAGVEGCAAGPNETCQFVTTRPGGYAARGSAWSMTIEVKDATGQWTTTPENPDDRPGVYGRENAPPQGCSVWQQPGYRITVSGGPDGGIAAGNPYPFVVDGTPFAALSRC